MSRTKLRESAFLLIFQLNSVNKPGEILDIFYQTETANKVFRARLAPRNLCATQRKHRDVYSLRVRNCARFIRNFIYNKENRSYIESVFKGIVEHLAKIDAVISANLRDWTIDRISKVSLTALRLAIFEAEHMPDVPANVAIDEAVSLAKKYEGDECADFVNGILGQWSRGRA